MKIQFSCLFWAFFSLFTTSAQTQTEAINLVINPSFEKIEGGTKKMELVTDIEMVSGWSSPSQVTTNIYSTTEAGTIYDNNGYRWGFKARTGKNVATLYTYGEELNEEKRQYIQGSLQLPLKVGKRYEFSFWVHYHCEGSSNIGIAFLPKRIKLAKAGRIELVPATYQKEVNPYNETETWTKVEGSFVAYKAYQYFVIGNFFSNKDTKVESNNFGHHLAYVDDIVVKELPESLNVAPVVLEKEDKQKWEANEAAVQELPTFKPSTKPKAEKTIIKEELASTKPEIATLIDKQFVEIPAIIFESGSSELALTAYINLDVLAKDLKTYTALQVRIIGHSSSEGQETYNFGLSADRAASIRNYLISQGVDNKQITVKALGIANPIGDNDTLEGRIKNRRVEIERFYIKE